MAENNIYRCALDLKRSIDALNEEYVSGSWHICKSILKVYGIKADRHTINLLNFEYMSNRNYGWTSPDNCNVGIGWPSPGWISQPPTRSLCLWLEDDETSCKEVLYSELADIFGRIHAIDDQKNTVIKRALDGMGQFLKLTSEEVEEVKGLLLEAGYKLREEPA